MLATFPLNPCKLHKHWVNKRPFHVRLGWNHFVSRGKISHFGFKCFMRLWHLIVSQWYTARCLPITNISFQDMTVDQNSIGSSHIVQIYQVPSGRASSIISVSISRSLSNYKLERRCDRDVWDVNWPNWRFTSTTDISGNPYSISTKGAHLSPFQLTIGLTISAHTCRGLE